MDEKTFKKVLRTSVDEAVAPRSNAWRMVQSRLPKDYLLKGKGSQPPKNRFRWAWRFCLAAAASLAVLLFAVIALNSPQGRALAQGVLQSLPVQRLLGAQAKPTPSLSAPTSTAALQPALAFYSQCGNTTTPICSIDQIRYLVSFSVKAPVSLPEGLKFIGATGGPDNVILVYRSEDASRSLLFYEGPLSGKVAQDIQPADGTTVETVQIGGATGEYLQGAWGSVEPAQTLRWIDNDILIELIMLGDPQLPSVRLEKAGLLVLAGNLSDGLKAVGHTTTSAQDAEAFAGFPIKLPSKLPPDAKPPKFVVTHESAATIVRIFYDCNNDVTLYETSGSSDTLDSLATQILNTGAGFVRITVNGQPGIWTGGFYENANQFKYQGDGSFHTIWFEDGIKYELYASFNINYSKEMFVNIANSMQPWQTTSLAGAQAQAGFMVRVPATLPDGVTFDYALYSTEKKTVSLFFHHPLGGKLSIDESTTAPFPTLSDLFSVYSKPGGPMYSEEVTVGGGKDGKGLYVPDSDYGQALQVEMDGLRFSIYAEGAYSGLLGGDNIPGEHFITQLEMIRLAESISGVHTVKDDQLEPEYLTSVQDAEAFAGFHIKLPTTLPPDAIPPRFSVTRGNRGTVVTIFYDCNNWFTVTEISGSTETLATFAPEGQKAGLGFDRITVHGQPGIWSAGFYSSGVWTSYPGDGTISTIWFEDGIEYNLYAFYNLHYSEAMFVAIAESMR